MKKRIKKDLTLKWPIRTNGYKTSLANRDLKCELIDPQGNSKVIEVTTDEHVVVIHLTPSLQTVCGRYRLTLWENFGKDGQTVVDKSNAIELVSSTEREDVTDNMLPTASEEINLQGDDLETGATVIGQQQADWNETDTTEASFIKNKPTSMPASDVQAWAKAEVKPTYTASEVGAAASGHTHGWSEVTGKPETFAPSAHTHEQYLTSADIAGKADKTEIPDISGKADKTEIPTTLPASDVYDWAKAEQKPTYTASEVKDTDNQTVSAKLAQLSLKVGELDIKTETSLPEDSLVDNTDYTIAVSGDVAVPTIPSSNKQGVIIRLNNTSEGAVERTLSFVSSVEWIGDKVSALGAGKAYMVAILDGIVSVNEITNE